jgi:hypothetical protein
VSGRTAALALAKSHHLQDFSNVGLPSSGRGMRREGACPTPLCMYRSSFQISHLCPHFPSLTLSGVSALVLIDNLRERNIPNLDHIAAHPPFLSGREFSEIKVQSMICASRWRALRNGRGDDCLINSGESFWPNSFGVETTWLAPPFARVYE